MRELMISIQPKWVEKIVRGEKTVEVRKTRPKCEMPFKCYIYETRNGGHRCKNCEQKDDCYYCAPSNVGCYNGRGRVIGHFICDKIVEFPHEPYDPAFSETADLSCIGIDGLSEYLGHKDYGYGWHITDLVVYDEPRELRDFLLYNVRTYIDEKSGLPMPTHEIARPFQSWGYVEAKEPRQTAN